MLYTLYFISRNKHAYKYRFPFCHFQNYSAPQPLPPWALNSFHSTWHLYCHCPCLSPGLATSAASKTNFLEILPPISRSHFWKQIHIFIGSWCSQCHQIWTLATTSLSTWKWTLVTLLRICTSSNFNSRVFCSNLFEQQDYNFSCLKSYYLNNGLRALYISSKNSQRQNMSFIRKWKLIIC